MNNILPNEHMRKKQLLITIGNFTYLFAQWAMTVVVVKLSTDYYMAGLLGLAMTVTNIFFIIASYGLRSYQVSDVQHEYSNQNYVLSRMITVPFSIVTCILYSLLMGYRSESLLVITLYMIYKAFEASSDVLYGIMQMNDKYDKICLSMTIKGIGSFAIFTVLLAIGASLSIALFAMTVIALITFILDVHWTRQLTKPLVELCKDIFKKTRKLLMVASPMVVLSIAHPFLMSIPRLYYEKHFSTELLGIYSSLSSPTLVITTLVSCALMPYIPLFATYFAGNKREELLKLTWMTLSLTVLFGIVAYIGGLLVGPWALSLLYGPSIKEYANVFELIIIVSTLSSLNMCLIVIFTAIRKLIPESIILLAGCFLCYFLTPIIVDKYAMEGVAYALIVAQTFQVVLSTIVAMCFIQKS